RVSLRMVWLNNKLVRALAKHSARPDMFYVSRRQRFGFHARGESRAVGAGHAMSVLLAHRSERTVTLACQRSGLVYQGHSLSALRPSPPLSTPPRARCTAVHVLTGSLGHKGETVAVSR